MAVVKTGDSPGFLDQEQPQLAPPLASVAESIQHLLGYLGKPLGAPGQTLKNFLNGTWLGHSLHAAMSDAPIGSWISAAVMDALKLHRAADTLVGLGIITAVPTAMAGVADWRDSASGPSRTGVWHALTNSIALGCYIGSWFARRAENRRLGVGLSSIGLGLVTFGAYLGGDMVYRQGMAVNRNAWDPEEIDWTPALPVNLAHEGKILKGKIEIEGVTLPVLIYRRGDTVTALSATCAHWGGPLADGEIVDGDHVKCPWHGSTFSMIDGTCVNGPSAHDQLCYEARIKDGYVQVRRAAIVPEGEGEAFI